MKVHTEEENEQLGVPFNLGESLRSIRPEVEDTSSTPFNLGESLRSISPIEESAPEIVDTPTAPTPATPDHIQFTGNPFDALLTPPVAESPVEPKIKEFIPAVQKGWAGLQGNLGQISLDQSEWNKKHPYLAIAKLVLGPHRGEWAGFGIDERRFKEITTKVEKWNQEAESKGELMTTDDINSLGDFVDYFQTMLGSSGPQMGISILSGGTMTPLMMTAELNNNLKDIEGLSLDDRMALASGGGVISAALENLGLGFIIRGVPKEVVAKIGINKLSTILEKSVLVKAGAKVTGSGLAAMGIEGTTEGLQEAVAVISENLGGREFKPGEITYRLKQAVAAGMTVGGPVGGVTSIPRQAIEAKKGPVTTPTPTAPVETPTLNLASIGKVVDAVAPSVAPTAGTEAAVDTYLPEVAEVETSAKPTGVIRKAKPFKIAEKPTVETVETVEKAVPEESSTEQSTPVQEEAVSPTLTEQPVIEPVAKPVIEPEKKPTSVETKENVEQAKLIKEQEEEVNKVGIESDLEDTFYTVESEGKTVKGTTPEVVKKEVEKSFGKSTIRKLTKNDGVEILATQKELEEKLGGKENKREDSKGAIIKGAFSKGKVYLVAENINEGEAGGVLLHEVGEHAALNEMVGDVQYEAISKNFDELLKANDPVAVAASERIPKRTPASKLKSEKLAYLVEEVQNKISAGEKVSSKARTIYNRVVNLIRNWLRKLPAYRKFEGRAALKRLQKGELLTPENIASLARAAVDFHATTDKKKFRKDFVQFSEEGARVTTTKEAEAWKVDNKRPERKKARIDSPELQQAAEDLESGEITFEEYQNLADKVAPIKKFDKVPEPATNLEVAGSINEGKLKKGKLLNEDGVIEDGDTVENRLDIPAYEDYDTWVATITPEEGGKIYSGTAKLKDVTFKTQPPGALKIAQGKGKYPLATMKGEWVNSTNKDLKAEADNLMEDSDWVQVGMNPERQSSFYAKEDKVVDGVEIKKGTPLASAEEVIQIGAFILAKKPSTQEAPKFKSKKTGEEVQFSEEAETDKPTTGININDSKYPFTKKIISGEKIIETRNTNSLKGQIGKKIGIIKTGKGKSQVVAYATVGEPIVYNTKEKFRKDQDKHLVEEGSEFDIKEDGVKYGYPLTDVEKVTPFPVTSKGIVSREIDQPPVKKEIEVDMEEVIDESQFAEVRKRFNEAKVKNKKASPLDSVKDVAERAKNIFTRSHPDLDPKKFGQTLEYLRQVQDVPSYAQWQTFQDIYEFIDKMSDAELEVFTYNIILPDMVKDLESGVLKVKDGELPFGYESLEQVKLDLKLQRQKARKTKTESGKTIEEAVAERNETMANLKNELIDEGLLSEELRKDEAYYHHQVIQFMAMEDKFKGDFNVNAQKAGVRTKKQGWQKARTGSTKDYNTSYLDAEFAVMSMMRSQLETKKLLDKIEVEENKFTEIEAQAKEEETTVEDLLRNSEDWKDYTIWKPNPDSVWFHTYTLNDKVAQEVLEQAELTDRKIKENKEALEKGEELPKRTQQDRTKGVEVTESDVGEAMIKGEDEKWIIPKELAKTLNDSRKPNKGIAAVSAWTLQSWKKWVLLNPERLIKYNINNSSGDIDIAVAYDLRILAETKQAAKDLFHDLKKHKLSPELQKELAKWRKKGVVDSGFAITEVDDFSRMYDKLFNGRPSNMKDETWVEGIEAVADDIITGPKKLAKGYWKNAKEYTTLRENILRLAAVRYFEKKIAENPTDKIYAASKSYEIDQIKDNDDRAAKLTRELIGDYGNISHAGQFIREHLMPFWSWTEINTPRYIRLLANSAKETSGSKRELAKRIAKTIPGKAVRTGIKAGVTLVQFQAMTALVSIWNHTFFPEEEEKLSEFERGQLHIIVGDIFQNGEVVSLRFSGAFSDALSWLSLHDTMSDYIQGKTVGEQFEEMWKAPINKLTGGLTPTAKVFYETVTGVSTWPDVFSPRPIRDRWKHIAKVFSAGIPYDWWTGKPSRGWGKNLSKLLLQSSDPGEAAYYKIRGLVRDFNDKAGDVSSGGFTPTDKGNALYYFKQSLKYGDMEAAERYLRDYVDLAGGPKKASKGLKISIKRAGPMGGLKKRDREAWLKTLTQAELKTLKVSRDWFKTTYRR